MSLFDEVVSDPVALAEPRALTRVAFEDEILAVLDQATPPDVSPSEMFQHKEWQLMRLFAHLSIVDAYHLHRRLVARHPSDSIAQRFARLTGERAARLITFLAGARRRAALTSHRV